MIHSESTETASWNWEAFRVKQALDEAVKEFGHKQLILSLIRVDYFNPRNLYTEVLSQARGQEKTRLQQLSGTTPWI